MKPKAAVVRGRMRAEERKRGRWRKRDNRWTKVAMEEGPFAGERSSENVRIEIF